MPITASCPSCETRLKISASVLGKKVRCTRCKHVFVAEDPTPPPPPPPVKKTRKIQEEQKPEVYTFADQTEDEDSIQERPRKRSASTREKSSRKRKTVAANPLMPTGPDLFGEGPPFYTLYWPHALGGLGGLLLILFIVILVTKESVPASKPQNQQARENDQGQQPVIRPPGDGEKPGDKLPDPIKPPDKLPDPKPNENEIAGPVQRVQDLTFRPLALRDLLPCTFWAKDNQSFFTLTGNGTLQRISLTDFRELKRVDLRLKCCWMCLSAQGILVASSETEEVLLIEEAELQVKHRFTTPKVARVLSTPNLSIAFALGEGPGAGFLTPMDLRTRNSVTYRPRQPGALGDLRFAVLSPDGRYLLAQGAGDKLVRYRLAQTTLVPEEVSYGIAQNGQNVCVSADSKYVCLPSGGGNYQNIPNHPMIRSYSTYVYSVKDLKKPAFVLDSGAYPRNVGFDPKTDLVYAQGGGHELLVYDTAGVRQKAYRLKGDDSVKQYLVHPDGRKLFILTGDKLFWVELPAA